MWISLWGKLLKSTHINTSGVRFSIFLRFRFRFRFFMAVNMLELVHFPMNGNVLGFILQTILDVMRFH